MKKNDIPRYLIIAFIAATLSFIFINSMLPPGPSSTESGRVAALIAKIFSPDSAVGAFLIGNVRKIAHFVEFAALGAEIALYRVLYVKKKTAAYHAPLAGFAVAFTDESIQVLSGRGPSITDVWLDVAGYLTGLLAVYAIFIIARKIKASRKK